MASAIITPDGARSHLRVILLAGAATMLLAVARAWAQSPWSESDLPFCPVYPPGRAPAIGPSNCVPVPEALWGPTTPVPQIATPPAANVQLAALSDVARLLETTTPRAAPPPRIPVQAPPPKQVTPSAAPATTTAPVVKAPTAHPPPAPQATFALRTPGAMTLGQIASMLGPASKRTVVFSLASGDEYKKSDMTHRVSLTWSGPLQGLVDQLGAIYGLDVAIDDTAIRFSSRPGDHDGIPPTTRTPEGRS